MFKPKPFFVGVLLTGILISVQAQVEVFTLEDCINYALDYNTTISRAKNSVDEQSAYLDRSEAARLPNLYLNAYQRYNSVANYTIGSSGGNWSREGDMATGLALTSEVYLYNGAKIKNNIRRYQLNVQASESDIQTEKDQVKLDILTAYINVLLEKENVYNSQLQFEESQRQLKFTEERKSAGLISSADLLGIKSQLAADNSSLVEDQNSLRISLVSLMQLMNKPVNMSFDIARPEIDATLHVDSTPDPSEVYDIALGIQPELKTAAYQLESSQVEVDIARADGRPQLVLQGSVGTSYSNTEVPDFAEQFSNTVNPAISLNLNVPIFQRKEVVTEVRIAEIQFNDYELELVDLKNELRQYIEQACTDVQIAQSNYKALIEQVEAEKELYRMSEEMFKQGMINSVDFLSSKNSLTVAETKFTQAKYSVILQNKVVDYYLGNTILF